MMMKAPIAAWPREEKTGLMHLPAAWGRIIADGFWHPEKSWPWIRPWISTGFLSLVTYFGSLAILFVPVFAVPVCALLAWISSWTALRGSLRYAAIAGSCLIVHWLFVATDEPIGLSWGTEVIASALILCLAAIPVLIVKAVEAGEIDVTP